jgi:hypothetical protein
MRAESPEGHLQVGVYLSAVTHSKEYHQCPHMKRTPPA